MIDWDPRWLHSRLKIIVRNICVTCHYLIHYIDEIAFALRFVVLSQDTHCGLKEVYKGM